MNNEIYKEKIQEITQIKNLINIPGV